MEMPEWTKQHPIIYGTLSCLLLIGSLWALFTEKAVVPTVAGWFGAVMPEAGIPWLPLIGSLLGLFLLVMIWVQVRKSGHSAVPVTKSTPQQQPQVCFGSPLQGADMYNYWFLSWWHISVWLETIPNPSMRSYDHCTAKLILERCESGQTYPAEKAQSYDMRCQSRDGPQAEFALRIGDEPKPIPIAQRTEDVPPELQGDFKSWRQYITDDQFFYGSPLPLLPGRYELRLEIKNLDLNKTWRGPLYTLTVPEGGKSNGHFILSMAKGS